jgi:hypothetical protein
MPNFIVFCQILCYHKSAAFRRPPSGEGGERFEHDYFIRVVRRSRYCRELYLQVA